MTIPANTTSFWSSRAALRFLAGCSFLIVVAHASAADAACPNPVPGSYTAAQINDCLNTDAVVTLTDGAVYTIDQSIVIPAAGKTLQGQGGPNRPVLRAVTNLAVPLLVESTKNNFMLKYLVFDGNSDARTNSDACLTSSRPLLGNVRLLGGSGWAVDQVEVANALCHSGMEVFGTSFTIQGSTFRNNGFHANDAETKWADGLTVLTCDAGHVLGNTFIDNTDVGLIVGGGHNCDVSGNHIDNQNKRAFAGLNVGCFLAAGSGGHGDHFGSQYLNNVVGAVTNPDKMAFGIVVGNEPWWGVDLDCFVSDAGSVMSNQLSHAVVNLAVDGIGTGTVTGNSVSNQLGTQGFFCTISQNYTAHYFGSAILQDGWWPEWFFATGCGTWTPGTPQPDTPGTLVHMGNSLNPTLDYPRRRQLTNGESLYSVGNAYHLTYRSDGDLVIYDAANQVFDDFAIPNHTPGCAVMQADGNFVVYPVGACGDGSQFIWNTATQYTFQPTARGAYAIIQGDGNFVIYDLSGTPLYQRF